MTPEVLLDAATACGLTVAVENGRLAVSGRGSTPPDLIDGLRNQANQIMRLLCCGRCGATKVRLIPAYWGPRFCKPCCALIAAEHDTHNSWPSPTWGSESK